MSRRHTLISLGALALVAACGGGGGGGGGNEAPPVQNVDPQGAFSGDSVVIGNPAAVFFDLLVLEDGSYFAYVATSDDPLSVTSVLQGSGEVEAPPIFSAPNGLEFRFGDGAPTNAPLNHAVTERTLAQGSADQGRIGFEAGYLTAYDSAVTLIDGAYSGSTRRLASGFTAVTSASISPTGVLTMTQAGCTIDGSLTARQSGTGIFDFSATYGSGCGGDSSKVFTGVAFYNNTDQTALILTGVNAARTDVFYGVLQPLP